MPVPGSHSLEHSTPTLRSSRPMDPFESLTPLYSPLSQLAGMVPLRVPCGLCCRWGRMLVVRSPFDEVVGNTSVEVRK